MLKMRKKVLEFIDVGKAYISEANAKRAIEREKYDNSIEVRKQNTIFDQRERIRLQKNDVEKIRQSLPQLEKAREHLVSALAGLQGFEGLAQRDLLLATNLTHGYIHTLEEYLNQQNTGLNHKAFERGFARAEFRA